MKKIFPVIFSILLIMAVQGHSEGKDLRPLFRKYGIPVYEQGDRGTCSVFVIAGMLEFEYACKTQHYTALSVEYLNWASNQVTGENEDGSFFSDAIKALKKYGICANEFFSYYIQNYSKKAEPSTQALKDAHKRKQYSAFWIKEWNPETGMTALQIEKVVQQLNSGHPVAIGFRWPKKDERYRKVENGVMVVPPEEGVFDGHSVLIVGYENDRDIPGGSYFIFKNSHGEKYGENGYGKMPYVYVEKYANDAVVIYVE